VAASRAGQYEQAQQLLNAAATLGNSPELGAARKQLQSDIEASRARPAPAAVPPPPVAAAPAVPDFVRAKPVAPLDVTYPQSAFDAGQQGYVIVEFTLDSKGHTSDSKIVESNPARVFDDAALQAVRHGRFDTSELGASGASRRARLRIAFKPAAKQPAE
jgi:protein TonB